MVSMTGEIPEIIQTFENAKLDGDIEKSAFGNDAFNYECAKMVWNSLLPFLTRDPAGTGQSNVVDSGGGFGPLIGAIKDLMDTQGQNQLHMNNIPRSRIRLAVVDIDPNKIAYGMKARAEAKISSLDSDEGSEEDIVFVRKDIMKMHELRTLGVRDNKTFIVQRATSQYFVPSDYSPLDTNSWPEAQTDGASYTEEQVELFKYYSENLYANGATGSSNILVIESTGDYVGLRRWEYMLAKLTKETLGSQKNLRYLTDFDFKQMIKEVNTRGAAKAKAIRLGKTPAREASRIPAKLEILGSAEIPGNYGLRNVEDLYKRYGNGMDFDMFRAKVFDFYEEATKAIEGDTTMFEILNNDLYVNLKYIAYNIQVKKRS